MSGRERHETAAAARPDRMRQAARPAGPRPWVRVANVVISVLLVALFLVHGVGNAFQLIGVGSPLSKGLSHAMLTLVVAHAVIGCYLTVDTLRTQRAAGVAYPALNRRFWAVRVSGAVLVVLVVFHVLVFWQGSGGPVRLHPFEGFELVMHLLLVAALAVHVLANAAPLAIGLGVDTPRGRAVDVILVAAVLLALMAVAFVVYYLRWSVI